MPNIIIEDKEFEPYISKEEIKDTVQRLAKAINKDYHGKTPLLLVALRGAFMFAADLMRRLNIDFEVEFIQYNSYEGTVQSGIEGKLPVGKYVQGKDVIIIEDIIDTGKSLDAIFEQVTRHKPGSASVVSLLVKPTYIKSNADAVFYKGKYVTDNFVVGYGMDYKGKGRNAQHIYKEINHNNNL